ncbi:MAG: flagellar export chaperone FliS [Clostridium sp.]|uniref:flagellar export chaperone FliS n=1 Tax=Clostridium sp. DSM 8431 TaxID=1761781 RepID=UPI0008E4E8BF|nr:flagellar export chaperone FliS [Clostridium sp. DSM 8431]MCR4943227.1 flagellar export chaperone FliS [Clostridium sp.]SFU52011.1 flagellar protein FliS [Clostridium sp. DSM 8431]
MYTNGYNVYKNNSINFASKEQLLLMLVDGAVKYAKRAEIAIDKKDVKLAHESLIRTQDIFIELMSTLNRDAGEWAVQLFKVYEFINNSLVQVNFKKDNNLLREILPLIEEVRDIWYEAYEKAKK